MTAAEGKGEAEKAPLPEKPWKKKVPARPAGSPPADKDAGGQIHADPSKLSLLLE